MGRKLLLVFTLLGAISIATSAVVADGAEKLSGGTTAVRSPRLSEKESAQIRKLQEKIANIRRLVTQLYHNPAKLNELNQLAVEVHRDYPQLPIVSILRYGRMVGFLRGDRRVVDNVRLHKFVIGGVNYGNECKLCDGTGLCPSCYGSGICNLCLGAGKLRNPRGGFNSCRRDCSTCGGNPLSVLCHRCRGVGALCDYSKLQNARGRMQRYLSGLSLTWAARCDYLGSLYYEGRNGMSRDPVRAREFFEAASGGNDAHAMYMLSVMLRKGEGGAADAKRSERMLLQAANCDWPDAMREMAMRAMKKRDYRQSKKWIYRLANPRYLGFTPVDRAARSLSLARLAAFEFRNGSDYMDSDVLVDYPQTVRDAFAKAAGQGDLLARVWLLCDKYQNDEYRINSEKYSHLERIKYKYTWRSRIVTDYYTDRKSFQSPNRIVCIENFFIALSYLLDNFSVVEFPGYEQYKDKSAKSDFFDFFCSTSGYQWHTIKYYYLPVRGIYLKVPDGYIVLLGKPVKPLNNIEVLKFSETSHKYYFFMELLMLCNFVDNESDNYNFTGGVDTKELMVVREYGLWTIQAGMEIAAAEKRINAENAKETPDQAAVNRDRQLIRERKTIIDVCRVNANEVWIALHRKLKGEARVFSVSEP